MKTTIQLFATFLLFLMLGYSYAQVPQAFNYQAVARNNAGNVLPLQDLGVRISLHVGSESGDILYSETFTPTTNEFGLFTLSIGTGTPVTGTFSTINWSDYQYWLQVEMDMSGGTSYADMGTSKLLSVPYAMHSASSVWKKSGLSIHYLDGNVGIGTNAPSGSTKLHVASATPYSAIFTSDYLSSSTHVVHAEFVGSGSSDAVGVYGQSIPADYFGIGGYFLGGYIGAVGITSGSGSSSYYGNYGYATTSGPGYTYGLYGASDSYGGVSYGVYCSGNGAYTGSWSAVSDAKFKNNIAGYSENILDDIMLLRPVTYSMKTAEYPTLGFGSGTEIGFIAQDVKTVFPSLVTKGAHPGATKTDPVIEYEALNYIGMIPILVKAIQEQQAEIELLREEIELLKSK